MLPLRDITIGQALAEAAQKYAHNVAVEYGDTTWTYEELDRFSDALARGFLAKGIRRGTHVGMWVTVDAHTIPVFYALQKLGAVTAMFYSKHRPAMLLEQLNHTECEFLVVGRPIAQSENGVEVCRILAQQKHCQVLTFGYYKYQDTDCFSQILEDADNISQEELEQVKASVLPQDPATILFTSGTSGRTKAVVGSHHSRINSGIQLMSYTYATEKDVFCVALPIFHCFCISTNMMAALAAGARLYLMTKSRTQNILDAISIGKCTIFNAVPTMYHALCKRPDLADYDLSSLRTGIIGGGTYAPEQFREFEETLGMTIQSSLGMTECTAGFTTCALEDPVEVRSTTVGRFMDHVEGKIVDPVTGETLPNGQTGEICARSYMVMMGYYRAPDLTAEAIDADGWLHTGDLGWLDETGYIHLCGRLKELVIRGGENISPLEVGNSLLALEKIRDIKVIGVPDEHYGEELCACIVPADPSLTAEEVREFAASRLAHYQVPRYVLFFDALPYNPTGKIVAAQLRQMVIDSGRIPGLKHE